MKQITLVAGALLTLTATLRAQDCPPDRFDYGPALPDEEIAQIVLSHYGPAGPLVPLSEDYERASRDVALIGQTIPVLEVVTHDLAWAPDEIIIGTSTPDDPVLACINTYYAAKMGFLGLTSFIVYFPATINVPAIAAIYADIPAVSWAQPNGFGCPAGIGGCCSSSWHYDTLPNGTWEWNIHIGFPGGPHGSCQGVNWPLMVSEDGVVTSNPDLNFDGVVNGFDLANLLGGWGLCPDAVGWNCPADLNLDGTVNSVDLAMLLSAWGASP